ncbi:MAG: hypothetical protein V3U80_07575 [Flavobacteriaceae bacterium]
MIKYKAYIKALFFILIILGLVGFANYRNAHKKVNALNIEFKESENLYISTEKVHKIIADNVGNILNKQQNNIPLRTIEEKIEENKMIENAEVFLTLDGTLNTTIEQRKPIARVLVNNNSYYIDDKGKKMPLSKLYSARVPIVKGVMSADDLKQVYEFVTKVLQDDFMKKQVVGIQINSDKEFVLKTRLGNQILAFGNLKNYDIKINKLKAFYQKALKDKSLKKYSKINLKFSKQVVCTKI